MKKEANNDIKISIVLPTYNGGRWILDAVNSIITQTEVRWELIVIDDCSTDGTRDVIKQLPLIDPRITVYRNEVNKRLPKSLNIGFEKARGKYLTWTSDDNVMKKDALMKLSMYLDNNLDCDLISMNEDLIDEEGKVIGNYEEQFQYKRTPAELLISSNIGAAFMYRRSVLERIGGYDVNFFCGEDYDYWCRIALNANIAYSSENIYQYRISSVSLTSKRSGALKENTKRIQLKYANDFFKKYQFTILDQAKFWLRVSIFKPPLKLIVPTIILAAFRVVIKCILFIITGGGDRYVKLRKVVCFDKRFSFSVKK